MIVVGLTGGIGCGKTTVRKHFQGLGIMVNDADTISRTLVKPGKAAHMAIMKQFGATVFNKTDSTLDRKKLADIIFKDDAKRVWLEELMHPLIGKELRKWAQTIPDQPYVIIEIPLLLEANFSEYVDRVLVVDCPENVQIKRVWKRDGIPPLEIRRILDAQATREDRLAIATEVLPNDGNLQELIIHIRSMHEHYLRLANHQPEGEKQSIRKISKKPVDEEDDDLSSDEEDDEDNEKQSL